MPRSREAAARCFGTLDAAVRRFLIEHPAGTVVALGEGLETQFWRVDNGTMRWLTVELPETLAVRRRLLPDGPRQHSYAGSALEPGWLDQVDPTGPVLVTAQGLLMYFQGEEVHQLITTIAERLPGSSMVLDVPEAMLRMVGRRPETEQATKLWTWCSTPANALGSARSGASRAFAT